MLQLRYLVIAFLGIVILASCSDNNENISDKDVLELEASYKINVLEPSGLDVNSEGNALYTVSDHTGHVYKLSTTGNVTQVFNDVGNDLEGVSSFTENRLLLAEERTKEIIVYDLATGASSKNRINYKNNDENSGIEGVTYNSTDGTIFILNEKNPGKLIRLRPDFSIIAEYELEFASDYSGIFYDRYSNSLWIVSDQNKTINQCTLVGKLVKAYSISVTQAEGIAIANNKIFVVSDAEAKLYIYKKPIN